MVWNYYIGCKMNFVSKTMGKSFEQVTWPDQGPKLRCKLRSSSSRFSFVIVSGWKQLKLVRDIYNHHHFGDALVFHIDL